MANSGPTIAKAFVAVIPTTKDAQKNLSKELAPELSEAGEKGGEKLSEGIGGRLKAGAGKLAGIAKAALAGAGVAAITKFVHDSVSAFSQFEQLTGGVEKIFDEMDTSQILTDAQNAYKTLGISANDYLKSMTNVGATFAATLGDAKGYDVAKRGMQAIADYASGTGRNVDQLTEKYTLITRATSSYQSIADQFAGILPSTSDAFLRQAQAAGLLSTDYKKLTEVPLPEYQEAVTAMMTRGVDALGLLGNTAIEATTTLEGSTNMLRSAWTNMLTAFGTGSDEQIRTAMTNLGESLQAYLGNLVPRLGKILLGVVGVLPELGRRLVAGIPDVIASLVGAFDAQLRAAGLDISIGGIFNAAMESGVVQSITAFAGRIQDAFNRVFGDVDVAATLDTIRQAASEAFGWISQKVAEVGAAFSAFLDSIDTDMLVAVFEGIRAAGEAVLEILANVGSVVMGIVVNLILPVLGEIWTFLNEHILPGIAQVAQALAPVAAFALEVLTQVYEWISKLVGGLIDYLYPAISALLAVAGPVFDFFFGMIALLITTIADEAKAVWSIVSPLIDTIVSVVGGMFSAIGGFINDNLGRIRAFAAAISSTISGLIATAKGIIRGGIDFIVGLISGIVGSVQAAMDGVQWAIASIWDGITSRVRDGIWSIVSAVSGIAGAIRSAFSSAFGSIRSIWNSTVGRISFSIPDWVPGVGGAHFSVPKLAEGGDIVGAGTVMVGEAGPELLTLPDGARVSPLDSAADMTSTGDHYEVIVGDVDLSDDDQVRRVTRQYLEYLAALARPALA